MKRQILTLLAFMLSVYATAQALIVANNNPGAAPGTNVFTGVNALEDAITAATANDIIYVVPSSALYGSNNINITKPLTIFGVGIRPSKALGTKSEIDVSCFNCAIQVDASDVRLSGLIVKGDVNLNWADAQDQTNITIENSRIKRAIMKTSAVKKISNILIRNNVITGNVSVATHILLRTTANAVITNNIFTESGSSAPMVEATGAIFTYNVFSDTGDEIPFSNVNNCQFDHNIFYGVRVDIPVSSTGNSWTNNLSFGNSVDAYHVFEITNNGNTGSGNIESTTATPRDPMFTNFPPTNVWNDSYDLTLLPGSPALSTDPLNLTTDDIGPSGGATPFDSEGNLLPLIQSITVPSVIPVGTDLPVTIKAKGN